MLTIVIRVYWRGWNVMLVGRWRFHTAACAVCVDCPNATPHPPAVEYWVVSCSKQTFREAEFLSNRDAFFEFCSWSLWIEKLKETDTSLFFAFLLQRMKKNICVKFFPWVYKMIKMICNKVKVNVVVCYLWVSIFLQKGHLNKPSPKVNLLT